MQLFKVSTHSISYFVLGCSFEEVSCFMIFVLTVILDKGQYSKPLINALDWT